MAGSSGKKTFLMIAALAGLGALLWLFTKKGEVGDAVSHLVVVPNSEWARWEDSDAPRLKGATRFGESVVLSRSRITPAANWIGTTAFSAKTQALWQALQAWSMRTKTPLGVAALLGSYPAKGGISLGGQNEPGTPYSTLFLRLDYIPDGDMPTWLTSVEGLSVPDFPTEHLRVAGTTAPTVVRIYALALGDVDSLKAWVAGMGGATPK